MATNQMRREAAKRKLARQQERRAQQLARRRKVVAISTAAVAVLVVGGIVALTMFHGEETPAPTPVEPRPSVVPATIPTAIAALPVRPTPLPDPSTCTYPPEGDPAKPVQAPPGTGVAARGTVPMTLQTSVGAIPLTLDRALAPCTVNSVVSLARQGYFDDTRCHRLTTNPGLQVLQCGDPTGTGSGGPGYTVPDEVFPELTYGRGILAMANTGEPGSGGSQFFMVYGDGRLPPQYTAFGSITPEGLQVVDQIARAGHDGSLDSTSGGGAPVWPVTISTATVP